MTEEMGSLKRPRVDELECMLGIAIPVLDDGFVRVIDYMGNDESIVQAARVSYGAGTKQVREDRALIRYLMRNRHTSPFEMCEIKMHVRVPIDSWRQWIRHRTASVNEYSTRYSIAVNAAQATEPDGWRLQSELNRQGSEEDEYLAPSVGMALSEREAEVQRLTREVYEERLKHGVAREQARKDLPLSTYTEAYWKIDLHNLFNFLSLRMDLHAQREIRDYANVIGHEVVAKWCPLAWDAFLDYRQHGLALSRIEIEVLGAIHAGDSRRAIDVAKIAGMLTKDGKPTKKSLERVELEQKLAILGLVAPWNASDEGNER